MIPRQIPPGCIVMPWFCECPLTLKQLFADMAWMWDFDCLKDRARVRVFEGVSGG